MKRILSLFLLAVLLVAPTLQGEESSGWKLPNPFSKARPPVSRRAASPASGWHWPRLWPASPPSQARTNQPSVWQKVTKGTQQMMSKTADVLNPWDDAEPAPPPKMTGSGSIFSQTATKKAKKKEEAKSSSILPAWFSGQPEQDKRPKTVNDFLAQPRPDF
jgi:hypothetical protein